MKTIDHIATLVDTLSALGRDDRSDMSASFKTVPIGVSASGQKVFLDAARCTHGTWSLYLEDKGTPPLEVMVALPEQRILFGALPEDTWAFRNAAENAVRQVLEGEFRA